MTIIFNAYAVAKWAPAAEEALREIMLKRDDVIGAGKTGKLPPKIAGPKPIPVTGPKSSGGGPRAGTKTRAILDAVRDQPGSHTRDIAARMGMDATKTSNHLANLKARSLVRFAGNRQAARWFPCDPNDATSSCPSKAARNGVSEHHSSDRTEINGS